MNILVTGGNGQLGKCLQYSAIDSENEWIFVGHDELDITNKEAINDYLDSNEINVIINCAAYTDVAKAENDYVNAQKVNFEAVRKLATTAEFRDIKLIHISTDFVFDGKENTPYKEGHYVHPINVYGSTKLMGEEVIRYINPSAIIIRTSWLYSPFGKNFVKTIYNKILSKRGFEVVQDEVGSPTYAFDLADAIVHIVDEGKIWAKSGVYHFANLGMCSRYDLAKHINALCGNTQILPASTGDFDSNVKRPAYSVLNTREFQYDFLYFKIPYWTDSLAECVEHLKLKTFE